MKKICLLATGILITLLPYAQTNETEKLLEELEENKVETTESKEQEEQQQEEEELISIDELNKELLNQEESKIPSRTTRTNSIITVVEDFDGTDVTVGKNAFIKYEEKNDTTKIKIGKKAIRIIENNRGTDIELIDQDDFEEEFNIEQKPKFKGHWAGFEMGVNTLVTKDFSFNYGDNGYMDLRTGRSLNININFLEYNLNISNHTFGLVTGLGFQLNDYRFEKNNNITIDDNGIIAELNYDSLGISLLKSKLSTSHLTLPLLLELQIPAKSKDRFFISAGIVGSLRIGSHTKVAYKEDGHKQKNKERKDFNLPPFRYGFTARMGYKNIKIFANYDLTPLFEKNKGPELYPFSVGFILLSL